MPRWGWFIGFIAATVLVAAYALSPWVAVHDLAAAARSGDPDRIDRLVDFPAVRAGLKDQLSARMLAQAGAGPGIERRPVRALGLLLLPAITDRIVDRFVTADGVAAMVKSARTPPASPGVDTRLDPRGQGVSYGYAYDGVDRFKATLTNRSAQAGALVLTLERRGLFGWKLIRVDLPADRSNPPEPKPAEPAQDRRRAAPAPQPAAMQVGDCVETRVKAVSTRLDGVADSGSAVSYDNGLYQVSYATVDAVEQSRAGDPVRLCLVAVPDDCPAGDERGKVYAATNRRTGLTWSLPDAEHMCGGA